MLPIRINLVFWALTVGLLSAQDFTEVVRRAVALQQAGDEEGAAAAYRQALAINPKDVATHVNLGVVLVHLGRFDQAIVEYETAGKLLPGDPRILLNLALAYEKSGNLSEARDRFAALHTASPGDPKLAMLLADCELQLGNTERVVALLQPLAGDTEDPAFDYMLGIALLRQNRVTEAQPFLDRILRHGDTAEARFLLGARMFESGDYPAAVQQLSSAAELNPRLSGLSSLLGQALLRTGDPASADAAFRRELTINPSDYQANLGVGQVLAARQQFAASLSFLRRALQMRSDSAEAKLAIAQALLGTNQPAQALVYAQAAVTALPRSADAHRTLSQVQARLHESTEAKKEMVLARQLAAESDPGPPLQSRAPDFQLATVAGKQIRLADFRGKKPVVVVFGSYSCPNFRDAAEALKTLYGQYSDRVTFLLVYIREAHAQDDWQSTRNVAPETVLASASTYAQKQEHATMCSRKLHLPFTALVDNMEGTVEKAYNAWPSRVFVIDNAGRVVYNSRLTALDFSPGEMRAALGQTVR